MSLLVLGLSHHTAPVEIRERFAYPDSEIVPTLNRLRSSGIVSEAVLLSTCNRVELYATSEGPVRDALSSIREFFAEHRNNSAPLGPEFYGHVDIAGVEHLFRVASGLDSLVLGETEILGQLKRSYDLALAGGLTGRVLNKAFQKAFSVAKKIRSETNIQRGNTSVASVAVDLAEKIFDGLADRDVMVIGAGEMSEKTARALLSRGARSLLVSNRSSDRAQALASELGGRAVQFDEWEKEFPGIDIVISSTSAPHYILDVPKLERLIRLRPRRSLLLIDIAVPRDIDPAVKMLDNVYLADVDDLQAIADEHIRGRREEIARCDMIIRDQASALIGGLGPRPAAPFNNTLRSPSH
jgi:glutamyl-tRNA reductase